MSGFQDIKVVLQTDDGKYLSGSAINWRFTEERSSAIVFDLFAQRVHQRAAFLSECLGFRLQPVPLPPEEIYESCDLCQCLIMARQVFFNGRQFLCPDCKAQASVEPQRLAA
jgi:hypothetical protein